MNKILIIFFILSGCASSQKSMTGNFKISGAVSDFEGRKLGGADVRLFAPGQKEIAFTKADDQGRFKIEAPRGPSLGLLARKDAREKSLGYWYWNIPSDRDQNLEIKIGALEVSGIKTWKARSGVMIYFRPTSLRKSNMSNLKSEDISITVNGEKTSIWGITRTKEYMGDSKSSVEAYLIHAADGKKTISSDWVPVCLEVFDRQSKERGQGCAPLYFE